MPQSKSIANSSVSLALDEVKTRITKLNKTPIPVLQSILESLDDLESNPSIQKDKPGAISRSAVALHNLASTLRRHQPVDGINFNEEATYLDERADKLSGGPLK